MEKFEQESQLEAEKNLEALAMEMHEKGYYVEKVKEAKGDEAPMLCDNEKDNCFAEAKWFIEGSVCCQLHAERMLLNLREDYNGREERLKKQEEERKKKREEVFKNLK